MDFRPFSRDLHRLIPRVHRLIPRLHRLIPRLHRLIPRLHRLIQDTIVSGIGRQGSKSDTTLSNRKLMSKIGGQWRPKSDASVRTWTLVSKIGQWCLNSTLLSKIGH